MEVNAFVARRRWLSEEGCRLDASAYSSGGLQARDRISSGPWETRRLSDVSELFYGGRSARRYVRDVDRGVPFLSSSDMLQTDLLGLQRVSTRRTVGLEAMLLREGWTLISRSGTIGNTAFVRFDMDGMAASEHIIRAVVKVDDLRPGYLFAFLSTGLAQTMISQKTYGAIVQHIEPHHIADIPVPVPDDSFGDRIQKLVSSAARARTEAVRLLNDVGDYFDSLAGPMHSLHDHARAAGVVKRSLLAGRLDAFHYVGWAAEASNVDGDRIRDLAEVISTSRVPRIYVQRGVPFLSGIDVFRIRPPVRVTLAAFVADEFDARVGAGELAIQGSGQRYGLLGRAAYIGRRLDGWAASHDLFRIRASDRGAIARIFAFLRCESGHRAMLRHSYGTSIPHVNPMGIGAVRVPLLPDDLTDKAMKAIELREQADADEDMAIQEVETWLAS